MELHYFHLNLDNIFNNLFLFCFPDSDFLIFSGPQEELDLLLDCSARFFSALCQRSEWQHQLGTHPTILRRAWLLLFSLVKLCNVCAWPPEFSVLLLSSSVHSCLVLLPEVILWQRPPPWAAPHPPQQLETLSEASACCVLQDLSGSSSCCCMSTPLLSSSPALTHPHLTGSLFGCDPPWKVALIHIFSSQCQRHDKKSIHALTHRWRNNMTI